MWTKQKPKKQEEVSEQSLKHENKQIWPLREETSEAIEVYGSERLKTFYRFERESVEIWKCILNGGEMASYW